MNNLNAIILAAGYGSRMHAIDKSYNKVCYPILGKPMVKYVVDAIKILNPNKIIAVVGSGKEISTQILSNDCIITTQETIDGTLSAVKTAEKLLKNIKGDTIIAYGDVPLIKKETLLQMYEKHCKSGAKLTILTSMLLNPYGYNRIIRDSKTQKVLKINEDKESSSDNYSTFEVDGGIYIFDNESLFNFINEVEKDFNNEFSLISLAEIFEKHDLKIETFVTLDNHEIYSINNRINLAKASKILKKRINAKLMLKGVSIEDPKTTYICPDADILPDTIISANTSILGSCKIGHSNRIGPNVYLENVVIGNYNQITFSHIVDSTIYDNCSIGPFSRLRGNCIIEDNVKISNFVEMKNVHVKKGSKCSHLSYIGDSVVGENTNIGCGTITANYDGYNKHQTLIGDNCFIGSGTILVAPINVENNAFTAAGSTLTKNVRNDELAIERTKQVNIPHGSSTILAKAKAKNK